MNSLQNELGKEKQNYIKLCLLFKTRNSEKTFFDYVEEEVFRVKHETREEKSFYCRTKYDNNIFIEKDQKEITNYCDILFFARKSNNGYYELIWPLTFLDPTDLANLKNLKNKLWLIQNSQDNGNNTFKYEVENKPYYLQENDIIKIGEKEYEITKLNIIKDKDSKKNTKSIFLIPTKNKISNDIDKKEKEEKKYKENSKKEFSEYKKEEGFIQEKDCRICYSSENKEDKEEDNPLIKICKCNTYIHFNCLKEFLKKSMKIFENHDKTVMLYQWDNFGCEVCQEPYPLKLKFNNTNKQDPSCLVDNLDPPENTNYMILESLTYIKNKKNIKKIFVVKLIKSEITIGKNEHNDIVDSDSTISRYHAVLKYDEKNGRISIINKGRYGTSVLMKNNVKLNIGEKIYLQVGRTYIKAEVKELSDEEKGELNKKEREKEEEKNNSKQDDENEKNDESTNSKQTNWQSKKNYK